MRYLFPTIVFFTFLGVGTAKSATMASVTADEYMAMTSYHMCRLELFCVETKSGKVSNRIYTPSMDFLEIPFTQETCENLPNKNMGTPPEDRCSDGT